VLPNKHCPIMSLAFPKVCLSDIRVIVVIMRIPLVESLCQAAIGWISTRAPIARRMCDL
jgi:hypothetical protein